MPDQTVAVFNGLTVQVAADMARTPGIVPDVGTLTWLDGTEQPGNHRGDLVFYHGGVEIVRWYDCVLDDPQEVRGNSINIVYRIKDRRWKWEQPRLFGEWNVRQKNDELVEETKKTPRELAEMALDALGETGYDVSVLPEDVELAPHVQWHYEPAAPFLSNLCDMFGCEIHLLFNNTVKIIQVGIGAIPSDTGLIEEPASGLIINQAPDHITAYAGDTLFESWLLLDAVGYELDGTMKPIELLSYRPDVGWGGLISGAEPSSVWSKLKLAGEETEVIEATVGLAAQHIWKTFRVVGFHKGMEKPLGYTEEDVFTESYTNTNETKYEVVSPWPEFGIKDSADTRFYVEAERRLLGDHRNIIVPPGCTVFDPRRLLPLEPNRVEVGNSLSGEYERKDAEVMGVFTSLKGQGERLNHSAYTKWRGGLRVNPTEGIVTLSGPVYRAEIDEDAENTKDESKITVPELYLRCGYRLRESPYGNVYHRNFTLPTGANNGTANGVVNRSDIYQYMIALYTLDYNDLTVMGTTTENTSTVDSILNNAVIENAKNYLNRPAPQKRDYVPIRSENTNGVVKQVRYSAGLKPGIMSVSIGTEHDRSQPRAIQKRIRELQKQAALKDARQFAKEPPRGQPRAVEA